MSERGFDLMCQFDEMKCIRCREWYEPEFIDEKGVCIDCHYRPWIKPFWTKILPRTKRDGEMFVVGFMSFYCAYLLMLFLELLLNASN